ADGDGDAVADVDDAGVLAGTDEHPVARRRQPLQVEARRLVRAVLGPHDRVHRQLEVVGVAPEDPADVLRFLVGEAERAMERFGHACTLPAPTGTSGHLEGIRSTQPHPVYGWEGECLNDANGCGRLRPM